MTNEINIIDDIMLPQDRKSLSSKTKETDKATLSTSTESFNENEKTKSELSSKNKLDLSKFDGLDFDSLSESEYRSHESDESLGDKILSSSKRLSAYSRSKSASRAVNHDNDYSKYSRDKGKMGRMTPTKFRTSHTSDYSNLERSSSRNRSRLRELMASGGREFSESRSLSRHRRRSDEIDYRTASGGSSRIRERIDHILSSGGRRLTGSRLRGRKKNLGEEIGHEDLNRSVDYMYGLYDRRENRHYTENDLSGREKLEDLEYENEDLKEVNHRLRRDIDEMKKQMEEAVQTSRFFSLNSGNRAANETLKKLSKNFSSMQKRSQEVEEENEKIRKSLRQLKVANRRHEDFIKELEVQKEETQLELEEKNEIIEALEREREELRHFLLESQIENKIISKKTDILQKKVQHLENGPEKKRSHRQKEAPKYLEASDQHTVSSLEE